MTVGRNRLPREGLMLSSVGTTGAVPDGGGVVAATEMVIVVVPGVGLPLLPQTVVTAATAMTTAPPARNGFTAVAGSLVRPYRRCLPYGLPFTRSLLSQSCLTGVLLWRCDFRG
jgi:hypothetical protein